MDIDATKRLRAQKAPVPSDRAPTPSTQPPPKAAEVQTRRFVTPATVEGDGQALLVELDPITGWLVVLKGPGRGRSLPLGYGVHPVGRADDQRVAVRFGDKKISRRSHVEVSYDGKGRVFYVLPGRGSTFGYLNDQPILAPSPLRANDRITLGDTELVFVPFCGATFDWQQA